MYVNFFFECAYFYFILRIDILFLAYPNFCTKNYISDKWKSIYGLWMNIIWFAQKIE